MRYWQVATVEPGRTAYLRTIGCLNLVLDV
jgi:hypothetical protein